MYIFPVGSTRAIIAGNCLLPRCF